MCHLWATIFPKRTGMQQMRMERQERKKMMGISRVMTPKTRILFQMMM